MLHPRRLLDRVLAHVRGASLDAQLACGVEPEASRLLATNAEWLASTSHRAKLAASWTAAVNQAHQTPAGLDTRVPVAREAVVAALSHVEDLVVLLRSPVPLGATGIARARKLITDGASAVYVGDDPNARLAGLVDDLVDGLAAQRHADTEDNRRFDGDSPL